MMTPAADHVDNEDIDAVPIQDSIGRMQNTTIINESGMCFIVLGRRNLTDAQKTYLIGRQYEAQKMTGGGDRRSKYFSKVQNGPLKKAEDTASKVARDIGVGRSTVKRAEKFTKGVDAAEKIESGARDAILSGKSKVPKSVISELPKMPKRQF